MTPSPPGDADFRRRLDALWRRGDFERAESLLGAWVHFDPSAAAAFVEQVATGDRRVDALRTVAREWVAISATDAMGWAMKLALPEERQAVGEFVCYRVAEDDPRSALVLATGAGFGVESPLAADLTQQWTEREWAQASQWVLAQPQGVARDQMVGRLVFVLAARDPAGAGRLVVDELPEGAGQEEAAISVVHQWALRDATGVALWVAQFPDGPLRTRAERELAGVGH